MLNKSDENGIKFKRYLRNKYYLLTLGLALSSDVRTIVSDKNLT